MAGTLNSSRRSEIRNTYTIFDGKTSCKTTTLNTQKGECSIRLILWKYIVAWILGKYIVGCEVQIFLSLSCGHTLVLC